MIYQPNKPNLFAQLRTGHWSTNGLVGYYPFTRAGNLVDFSPNKNNGTITGPTWVGEGLLFRGWLQDDWVDCGVSPAGGQLALTVEMIVRLDVITTHMIIAEDGTAYNTNSFYLISLDPGLLEFQIYAANYDSIKAAVAIVANRDYHVVGTWRSGARTKLYVDGQDVGVTAAGTLQTAALWVGNTNLYIGGRPASPLDLPLSGMVRLFRIYNRALSASEIQSLYINPNQLIYT